MLAGEAPNTQRRANLKTSTAHVTHRVPRMLSQLPAEAPSL